MAPIDAYAVVMGAVTGMVAAIYTATGFKPATLEIGLPPHLFQGLLRTLPMPEDTTRLRSPRTPDGRRALELHAAGGLVLTITEER